MGLHGAFHHKTGFEMTQVQFTARTSNHSNLFQKIYNFKPYQCPTFTLTQFQECVGSLSIVKEAFLTSTLTQRVSRPCFSTMSITVLTLSGHSGCLRNDDQKNKIKRSVVVTKLCDTEKNIQQFVVYLLPCITSTLLYKPVIRNVVSTISNKL